VTTAILRMDVRLRARMFVLAGIGLMSVAAIVGALFPSLGDSIGDLDLPGGVSDLLGGGDFSTIAGWLRTEIASVYGPLVVAGVAITAAAATIAGEEEDRILALILAHPVPRARLLLAKAGALGLMLAGLAVAIFAGLLIAVAIAGGGISASKLAALALHLLLLGFVGGALALAIGAATGRRGAAAGGAASVMVLMFLVNGFAPAIDAVDWLEYLTFFHYYEGHDPLVNGVWSGGLTVLAASTAVLLAAAVGGFARRDLRG
jgi:ABC-2 type transport system permease protein